MKFTRGKRIALELLGPPTLGAGLWSLALIGEAVWKLFVPGPPRVLMHLGEELLLVFLYAYVFTGIQSIFYTAIMEDLFKSGLDPRSWRMVRLSSLLGFGSGAVLMIFSVNDLGGMGFIMLMMGGLGALVGFLLGLLIRWGSKPEVTTERNEP